MVLKKLQLLFVVKKTNKICRKGGTFCLNDRLIKILFESQFPFSDFFVVENLTNKLHIGFGSLGGKCSRKNSFTSFTCLFQCAFVLGCILDFWEMFCFLLIKKRCSIFLYVVVVNNIFMY